MSDRVPFQARVDEDVLERFRSYVENVHGKRRGRIGHEAENALLDYMDETPERRLEKKMDEMLSLLREMDDAHAHTNTVTQRTQEIARQLKAENGEAVKGRAVERVIGEVAGSDPRTVERYQDQLKKRGLLYEHPGEAPLWYTDKEVLFAQIDEEDISPLEDYPDEVEDEFMEWCEESDE